jgi:flavin-dependent dehydrogenase
MASARLDLVVVGGGPAGISTALHLHDAAPGVAARTVVVEKARYPRDKFCAGAIGGRALRLLQDIGVRVDVPQVPIHAVSLRAAGQVIVLREPDLGVVVRRIEFDEAFAREATRRGIEVREDDGVERVEPDADGVRLTLASGRSIEARAVVGADGVAGAVRRSIGLSRPRLRAQVVEADTEESPGDPARDTLHFDFDDADLAGYGWDFPTQVGGRALVCRGVYRIARGEGVPGADASGRDDVRKRFESFLARRGLEMGRYKLKPFAEQGFHDDDAMSAPRVLLAGEAAGIDIATGEGIAQAIQYGALAGPYLARAFERGDLSFGDWKDHVRSRRLGWQLRQRLWVYRRFYGVERPVMERLMLTMPAALRLGILQFAGKSFEPRAMLRALGQAGAGAARLGPARVWRAMRAR